MPDVAKKKRSINEIDETGKQVAKNVRRLRGAATYRELSDRLSDLGRPITVLGLRRIEACERKVDVDDLAALAMVFDVSPLTLLLPDAANSRVTARVTGARHEYGSNVLWLWGTGKEPLELQSSAPDNNFEYSRDNLREITLFNLRSVPAIEDRLVAATMEGMDPDDDLAITQGVSGMKHESEI
ncbi:MAG: hypothetical protein SOI64_07580 [Bifidobacterium mongoliense]|jgi:hypothetical protein|uniref:hypothetical protein n=1 Tax=Bifidobacterium mongoliense TaxID=518643 RepID=UPI002F356F0D